MASAGRLNAVDHCHCMAVRKAARWISQLYDRHLAACGLSSTQYAMLSHLERAGGAGVAQLAEALVMDRTTMTRTLAPLQRDGLVEVAAADADRRRKVLTLTATGRARLAEARPHWKRAQQAFEGHFGADQAELLRLLLQAVPGERLPVR